MNMARGVRSMRLYDGGYRKPNGAFPPIHVDAQ
jgi:hypothetical protein